MELAEVEWFEGVHRVGCGRGNGRWVVRESVVGVEDEWGWWEWEVVDWGVCAVENCLLV